MSNHKITYNKDNTVTISGNCIFINKPFSVTVDKEGYEKFKDGELIQRAFPNVSREDREFIRSGISPEGWKERFGGLDE